MRARYLALWFLWLLAELFWLQTSNAASGFAVLTNQFAGPPLVGYGVQISSYLTAPNMGQPVGDQADLEQKIKALAPQHVRIFVLPAWWRPGNERMRESFIHTCRVAQSAGATINLTLWSGWTKDPSGSSKDMVRVLDDVIRRQGLRAVRYLTLQNEVNSTWIPMDLYNAFYRMFDRDLRAAGLRDQIEIVGGDLVRSNQAAWFQNLATELADICDGYSLHSYWEYPQGPANIPQRFRDLAAIQQKLPAQGRRPLYITEFGVRGKDWHGSGQEPGVFEDGTPIARTWISSLQVGWFMTEATRLGVVATVQWEACDVAYPHNRMHYGLLGEAREGWPLRPSYHVLRLFTHTIAPGWRALQIEGESPDVALAAVRGRKGEMTILALNHSDNVQPVSITNLPPKLVFRRLLWSATEKDHLQDLGEQGCSTSSLELSSPPRSLTALTAGSDRWKDLQIPLPNR